MKIISVEFYSDYYFVVKLRLFLRFDGDNFMLVIIDFFIDRDGNLRAYSFFFLNNVIRIDLFGTVKIIADHLRMSNFPLTTIARSSA